MKSIFMAFYRVDLDGYKLSDEFLKQYFNRSPGLICIYKNAYKPFYSCDKNNIEFNIGNKVNVNGILVTIKDKIYELNGNVIYHTDYDLDREKFLND